MAAKVIIGGKPLMSHLSHHYTVKFAASKEEQWLPWFYVVYVVYRQYISFLFFLLNECQ